MPDALPPTRPAQGAGVFAHAETETIDLGVHGGRRFQAQVEHRTLRIAWGRRQTAALMFGRRRAVLLQSVSVEAPTGVTSASTVERYDVRIPRVPDPWPQFALRVTVVAATCLLATAFVERLARGEHDGRGRT